MTLVAIRRVLGCNRLDFRHHGREGRAAQIGFEVHCRGPSFERKVFRLQYILLINGIRTRDSKKELVLSIVVIVLDRLQDCLFWGCCLGIMSVNTSTLYLIYTSQKHMALPARPSLFALVEAQGSLPLHRRAVTTY